MEAPQPFRLKGLHNIVLLSTIMCDLCNCKPSCFLFPRRHDGKIILPLFAEYRSEAGVLGDMKIFLESIRS